MCLQRFLLTFPLPTFVLTWIAALLIGKRTGLSLLPIRPRTLALPTADLSIHPSIGPRPRAALSRRPTKQNGSVTPSFNLRSAVARSSDRPTSGEEWEMEESMKWMNTYVVEEMAELDEVDGMGDMDRMDE